MGGSGTESVFSSLQAPLRAIGSVVLPSPEALDEEGWLEAEAIIEGALASKPRGIKRQIRLFLRFVNILPIFRTGQTLVRLPLHRRSAFLERLQRSSIMPLRRGMWGIRTLLFMGYYNQERVRRRIGYAADPRGWGEPPLQEEGGGPLQAEDEAPLQVEGGTHSQEEDEAPSQEDREAPR